MRFESCFGGFAGSKSAPAAMGGLRSFAGTRASGEVAPIPAIRNTRDRTDGSITCGHSLAALIVLVENNMVPGAIHGMIAMGGRSEEVASELDA